MAAIGSRRTLQSSALTELIPVRTATLAKLQRVMTAAQTNNSQDVTPLGITPTTSMAATLPQNITYAANPGVFEVLGGTPLVTTDPNYYVIVDSNDAPNTGGGLNVFMPGPTPYYWQFAAIWNVTLTNGRYIEIGTREMGGAYLRLYVNGVLAQAGRVAYQANAGSGLNWTKYDLGATGTYELGIEVTGSVRFNGVNIEAGASLSKPTRADTMTALFLGDSYTAGVVQNTTTAGESMASILGRYLGAKNAITCGLSGSAVVTNNGVRLAPDYYATFVQGTIKPYVPNPDMVVIAWGYNDNGSQNPTVAGLYALWQRVRADYPAALIVVVGMWTASTQVLVTLQNREEVIRAQFIAWADPFSIFLRSAYAVGTAGNNRIMFGPGNVGAPQFLGINDYIGNADNNHLTDGYDNCNGQWYMATRLRDQVISRINDLGTAYNPANTKIAAWPLSIKLSSGTVPAATHGVAYLLSFMVSGGVVNTSSATTNAAVRTYSITSGAIPTGMTLQTTAGHITGTPTTAGTYNFTVQVSDGVSTASLPVTVVVA